MEVTFLVNSLLIMQNKVIVSAAIGFNGLEEVTSGTHP